LKHLKKILKTLVLLLIICNLSKAYYFSDYPLPKGFNSSIPRNPDVRISSYPYISGDTFRAFCDFIVDETRLPLETDLIQDGDTIFVNADFLEYFFLNIHQKITKKYILVTHNSTMTVPGKFEKFLMDEKLVAWFGKNAVSMHPKMRVLPIGLANAYWPHGNVNILKKVVASLTDEKPFLLYLNIDCRTNTERKIVFEMFAQKSFCYTAQKKPFEEYLKELSRSYCVLSPEGAGLDCHRTWEAMLMGSIPVLKHSGIDTLYKDLPVILIDDWSMIHENFLKQQVAAINLEKINWKKLYADYWLEKIRAEQHKLRYNDARIPNYFGVNYDDSMEHAKKYKRAQYWKNKDWNQARELYKKNIQHDLQYATEPRIPKIIHQIWLGSPFPKKYEAFRDSWLKMHPDWIYKLWTDSDIEELNLVCKDLYNKIPNYGAKADIARYEILYRFGGLYIDTDFECLKPFDIFHHTLDFYAGSYHSDSFGIFNGLLAARPGCLILKECIDCLSKSSTIPKNPSEILNMTGPKFLTNCFTRLISRVSGRYVIFPITYFYAWPWWERDHSNPDYIRTLIRTESFALHYWDVSWNGGVAP